MRYRLGRQVDGGLKSVPRCWSTCTALAPGTLITLVSHFHNMLIWKRLWMEIYKYDSE